MGADLLDDAAAQDDDLVGQRHRLDLIVGDVDHGGIAELAVQARRSRPASRPSEARRRVDKAVRRTGRSSGSRTIARPMATAGAGRRRAFRPAVEQVGERRVLGPLAATLERTSAGRRAMQAEAHVLGDRHVRVERTRTEDHGDAAVGGSAKVTSRPAMRIRRRSARRAGGDEAQERGLAAADGPTNTTNSPGAIERSIDFRTSTAPKDLTMPRSSARRWRALPVHGGHLSPRRGPRRAYLALGAVVPREVRHGAERRRCCGRRPGV